jgi:hypothetical protein
VAYGRLTCFSSGKPLFSFCTRNSLASSVYYVSLCVCVCVRTFVKAVSESASKWCFSAAFPLWNVMWN